MNNKIEVTCPHCTNMDSTMMELTLTSNKVQFWYCIVCGKNFHIIIESPTDIGSK